MFLGIRRGSACVLTAALVGAGIATIAAAVAVTAPVALTTTTARIASGPTGVGGEPGPAAGPAGAVRLATDFSRAASPAWSQQSVPAPRTPTGTLAAISCPSAGWCMAVGSYLGTQAIQRPLAERWNGTSWQALSPATAGGSTLGTSLLGVSCTSRTSCVAVGSSVVFGHPARYQFMTQAFAERWNGTTWKTISPPRFGIAVTRNMQLTSVSCARGSCTAVGSPGLLVTWNGKHWFRSTPPAPKGAGVTLSTVSCASSGACTAAGSYHDGNLPDLPLTESRSRPGSRWSYRTPPPPFPHSPADLRKGKDFDLVSSSVSCTSASACIVVGNYRHEGTGFTHFPLFTESWNGQRWRLLTAPVSQPDSFLYSVSCWSAGHCLALGETGNLENDTLLAEQFSGSTWRTVTAPPASSVPGQGDRLLACTSATACVLVGPSSLVQGGVVATRLQGTTWTAGSLPEPAGTWQSALSSVSCASRTDCTAVGSFEHATGRSALAESGRPGSWSVSRPAQPSGVTSSALSGVSCPVAGFCAAVGYTLTGNIDYQPLAETRTSTGWHIVASPPAGSGGGLMSSVSCPSASFCVAVGDGIESWNGTGWHVAAAVPSGRELKAVSCASASYCLAIGAVTAGQTQPLAETWNGTAWTPVATTAMAPNLASVSCPVAGWCMAAGTSASLQHVRAQTWNGTTWTTVTTPNPSPSSVDGATFTGVSCVSRTACTAVGNADFSINENEGPADDYHPFGENWTGSSFGAAANLPVPARTLGTPLTSVSCAAARVCVTAGTTDRVDGSVPAIESLGS
jgi:hypothetical protein